MKQLAFLLIAVTTIASARADSKSKANAEAPAAPNSATESDHTEKSEGTSDQKANIELKTKSSFQMEGDNRNPFWPIGWRPVAKLTAGGNDHAEGEIASSAFHVSAITMDPKTRFAIINGKIMQEGQQFGLQIGNQTYPITVTRIEDGQVILSRRNQEIAVTLRRK